MKAPAPENALATLVGIVLANFIIAAVFAMLGHPVAAVVFLISNGAVAAFARQVWSVDPFSGLKPQLFELAADERVLYSDSMISAAFNYLPLNFYFDLLITDRQIVLRTTGSPKDRCVFRARWEDVLQIEQKRLRHGPIPADGVVVTTRKDRTPAIARFAPHNAAQVMAVLKELAPDRIISPISSNKGSTQSGNEMTSNSGLSRTTLLVLVTIILAIAIVSFAVRIIWLGILLLISLAVLGFVWNRLTDNVRERLGRDDAQKQIDRME